MRCEGFVAICLRAREDIAHNRFQLLTATTTATTSLLQSVIQLSLQHIGKADINILPQQQQALSFVLSGRDTVVNLPTGFGKSLVF